MGKGRYPVAIETSSRRMEEEEDGVQICTTLLPQAAPALPGPEVTVPTSRAGLESPSLSRDGNKALLLPGELFSLSKLWSFTFVAKKNGLFLPGHSEYKFTDSLLRWDVHWGVAVSPRMSLAQLRAESSDRGTHNSSTQTFSSPVVTWGVARST